MMDNHYGVHCDECPLKGKSEPQDGRGVDGARFMVVTGAPAHQHTDYGRLLHPYAMKVFTKFMGEQEFGKEDFFFVPAVRCPHDPDQFSTKEKSAAMKCCRGYYTEELTRQNPIVVIPLGADAAKQVFGRAVKITKMRGVADMLEGTNTMVLPMLNPMQVALYPQHEPTFKSDCATLGRLVDNAYDVDAAVEQTLGNYEFVDDLQFLVDRKNAGEFETLAFDTEGTSLRWFAPDSRILTMQFSVEPGVAYMLAWDHPDQPRTNRWKKRIKDQLRQLLCDPELKVVGQNLKYDGGMVLAHVGLRMHIGGDTLMLAQLLDENAITKNLDDLAKRYVPEMAGYADCVAPDTELLLDDLTKKLARDIVPGDRVVGFDEHTARGESRKLRDSFVETVRHLTMPSYIIEMDSGECIQVSANHQFLLGPRNADSGGSWRWREARELSVGDKLKLFPMPDAAASFADGWLAGILDGEGYATKHGPAGLRLGFAQNTGLVLQRAQAAFCAGDNQVSLDKRKSLANVTVTGRRAMHELVRLRPVRLVAKKPWVGKSLFVGEGTHSRIRKIEYVGRLPVVSIQTSTRTFMANGFATHNCFNLQVDKSKMIELPLDNKFLDYGCGDADCTLRLHETLYNIVAGDAKLLAHYARVTIPGLNALLSIEARGLVVDEAYVETFETFMEGEIKRQYESLLRQVPRAIKRAHVEKGLKFSRKDFVLDILFRHEAGFRLTPKVFTKTTAKLDRARQVPSTSSKDHLPYFFDDCPFTFELAAYVKGERILSTNVKGFKAKYIVDGMVRPTYALHRTVTGRCLPGHVRCITNYGPMSMEAIGDHLRTRGTPVYVLTHRNRFRKVTDFVDNGVRQTYRVETSDGLSLPATSNHPFFGPDGWVPVSDLSPGVSTYTMPFDYGTPVPETWLAVEEDERYEVSSAGGVRFTTRTGKVREVRPYAKGRWGHVRVRLGRGGRDRPVHQLVCTAFHGPCPSGMECLHTNGIPADNRASNLHWGTAQDNRDDMVRQGRSRRGERSNQHVLSDADVTRIRALRDTGIFGREVAALYGVSDSLVFGIWRGDRRKPAMSAFTESTVTRVVLDRRCRTYDISVEEDHSFVCEGFVVHNTSSEDPNGQNFPKRGPVAKAYRKLFIAPPGHFLLECDLSQAELRIAGDMANDPTMLRIYRDAGDIHTYTALIVMSTTMEQFLTLPKDEQKAARTKAKAVNFGFLYGMGWRKFIAYAKTQYGVEFTEKEAKRIRAEFFERYYKLPEWHAKMRAFVREHHFVRSYSGRIRHLPMIESGDDGIKSEAERQAINSPVQEFGSSLGVMACGRLNEEVDESYLSLVGFVHDAIYAYVPKQYIEWGAKTMAHYMETNPLEEWFGRKMKLPIVADASIGLNLGETYELGTFDRCDEDGECDVGTYDFGQFWDTEKKSGLIVPRQKIPPNNGRLLTSIYG